MMVVDASVLIGHLNEIDLLHDRAATLLADAADHALAASVITLAEVLVGPTRSGTRDRAEARLRELDVMPVGLTADEVRKLAGMRAESNLKLPDCCVIAAAELVDGELATFDARLAAAARARGLVVHG